MSVPFGAARETLSQQLTRIEASRPARRDTSGVVVIDDALRDMLAGQPVPAFRGLTASRFFAENRTALLSARWGDGEWMAGDRPMGGPLRTIVIDGREDQSDVDTRLAEYCRDHARVEAARVESLRRRADCFPRPFRDDFAWSRGAVPDVPDVFTDEIPDGSGPAMPSRRSSINWEDLPEDDDSRLSAGEIALGLSWFAAACGLAWCFYQLFALVAEVW